MTGEGWVCGQITSPGTYLGIIYRPDYEDEEPVSRASKNMSLASLALYALLSLFSLVQALLALNCSPLPAFQPSTLFEPFPENGPFNNNEP